MAKRSYMTTDDRPIHRCGECASIEPLPDKAFDTGLPFWGRCPVAGICKLFSEKACENFKCKVQ